MVSTVFPIIEFLLSSLEAAKKDPKFELIHGAIGAGIANLEKWYRKLDVCHVYVVCNGASNPIIHSPNNLPNKLIYLTVLDPSIKLGYIKKNWEAIYISRTKTALSIIVLSSILPLTDRLLNIQSSSIGTIKLLKTSKEPLLHLRSQVGTTLPHSTRVHSDTELGTSSKQQPGLRIELDADGTW